MAREPNDDDFVRFDATRFDPTIRELGIQRRFFADGYIWLTKYWDVKNIRVAADRERILYRKKLWKAVKGKFDGGATLRVVIGVADAVRAGRTNLANGVRQWRIARDIAPAELTVIKRLT